MSKNKSGFTVVELLIAIVVLVILATITAVTYTGAQAKARDTRRKADLTDIAEAVQLYRQKFGDDVQTGSGCGSAGNGNGWFNYSGSTYPASILSCLQSAGYLDGNDNGFVDPTGCTVSTGSGSAAGSPIGKCSAINGKYYAYMKYSKGTGDNSLTCIYARLETEDHSTDVTNSITPCGASATMVSSYNMNYVVYAR